MEEMKQFILNLTLVCLSLQIGNILISKDKYRRLYGLICAAIIISMILRIPIKKFSINTNEYVSEFDDIKSYSDTVKNKFLENVNKKLEDDIYHNFGIRSKVDSDSDFQRIIFNIVLYDYKSDISEISNYIRNNYCTENDEVYIKNGI